MLGFGHIGQFALGFIAADSVTPLVYKPVSRIVAGGFSTGRPAQVAELGVDLEWDDESEMIWDNDNNIDWS